METDYEKMYNNLNELLQDICKFLNADKLRDLSPKDKKLADSLIGRCKVQLQEISKIQQAPTNDEYVDMNSKTVVQEEERKSNIYSSVDDNVRVVQPTLIEEAAVYPYKDLPARDASQEVKYGCISMRRRFLLGFEKTKRFYATIHKNWLLVYCNEKDTKPIMTFNLKNYEARTDNERSTSFELMSTLADKKTSYSFMAITPKDMLQWVVKINKCHDNVILQTKGLCLYENTNKTNEDDAEEHYDSVIPPCTFPKHPQEEEEEEENIYLELDVVSSNKNNNTTPPKKTPEKNIDIRPALPGRRPMRNLMSIPVAPPTVKSLPLPQEESDDDGSIVSYDDIKIVDEHTKQPEESTKVCNQNSRKTSQDAYSDEDEDCTYEAFVDVQDIVKKTKTQEPEAKPTDVKLNDGDQKTVEDQQPSEVAPPPVRPKVKDKPPVSRKPAISARIASIKKQFKDF